MSKNLFSKALESVSDLKTFKNISKDVYSTTAAFKVLTIYTQKSHFSRKSLKFNLHKHRWPRIFVDLV